MAESQKDWTDIGFSATAVVEEYRVTFTIYTIEGTTEDDCILWHRDGASSWPDPVSNIAEAEVYLHGEVTWDGCSNWHFDEQDRIMLHGCSRKNLTDLGEVMARCWDWTSALLPTFEG